MRDVRNYGDERQTAWCVHCGSTIKGSRDHVPSKIFLDVPYPDFLPVVDICPKCNQGFSSDEEYLACFIECVVCGTTDPEKIERQKIRGTLNHASNLRARIEKSKRKDDTIEQIIWTPETERVNNILLKLARGHALSELNEPMFAEPAYISILPISLMNEVDRGSFENTGPDVAALAVWPEVSSRAMQRLVTGDDLENGWVIVQRGRYRFQAIVDPCVKIKIVIREYLAAEIAWDDE